MQNILAKLADHAQNEPDQVAVAGSKQAFSWCDLSRQIAALGGRLPTQQRLALLARNHPAWLIADLAISNNDNCCVPLPAFFNSAQQRHILDDSQADYLLLESDFIDLAGQQWSMEEKLDIAGKSLALMKRREQIKAIPSSAAKITYTSGTSGQPKGVPLSAERIGLVADALMQASNASSSDAALVLLPLSTLLENIGALYVPILAGAKILLPDASTLGLQDFRNIDIDKLCVYLQSARPSSVILTPELLKLFVSLASRGMLPDSFRFIAVGGAPVDPGLLHAALKLGLPVYQGYGLSEAGSVVSLNTPAENRPGSVGKPVLGEVKLSPGGRILLADSGFSGYLHQTTTAAKWLDTGDVGYFDEEGFLFVTGRTRNVIITSHGRNVSPEWVEAALTAQPSIEQATVFGDNQAALGAILVASSSSNDADIDAAVTLANAGLPDYAQVRHIVIAPEPFTPVNGQATSNGRVRRQAIMSSYADEIRNLERSTYEPVF